MSTLRESVVLSPFGASVKRAMRDRVRAIQVNALRTSSVETKLSLLFDGGNVSVARDLSVDKEVAEKVK
jgi:predicted methyltransferase MtxX (methanogen marker protein 4)